MPSPEFKPKRAVEFDTALIAGHRVFTATTEHGTAAISSQGVSVDVLWPDLGTIAKKLSTNIASGLASRIKR